MAYEYLWSAAGVICLIGLMLTIAVGVRVTKNSIDTAEDTTKERP